MTATDATVASSPRVEGVTSTSAEPTTTTPTRPRTASGRPTRAGNVTSRVTIASSTPAASW